CGRPSTTEERVPYDGVLQTTQAIDLADDLISDLDIHGTLGSSRQDNVSAVGVMNELRYSSSPGISLISSPVLPSWVSLPLTYVRNPRLPGSGTSAASTSQGPSTVAPSRFLTRRLGRYQFSR